MPAAVVQGMPPRAAFGAATRGGAEVVAAVLATALRRSVAKGCLCESIQRKAYPQHRRHRKQNRRAEEERLVGIVEWAEISEWSG